jgi:hypothetical protein
LYEICGDPETERRPSIQPRHHPWFVAVSQLVVDIEVASLDLLTVV